MYNSQEELQEAITNNTLMPENLSEGQREAIDQGLQSGVLTGHNSLNAYETFKQKGAEELADQIQRQEETVPGVDLPIVGQSFTDRAGFTATGSIMGAFGVYGLNQKELLEEVKSKGGRKFGPNYAAGFVDNSKKVSKILGDLPLVKRFGLPGRFLARTIGGIVDSARKVDDAVRLGMTKATSTELKSVAGGSLGAGAGSVIFDIINDNQEDLAKNVAYDMQNISQKEVDKLDPYQKNTVNALQAMKEDLLFAGGATVLSEAFSITGKAFSKFLTGTGTQYSKDMAEAAQKYGIDLNLGQIADEKTVTGKLIKTYFQTVGILPGVSQTTKVDRARFEEKVAKNMFKFAEDFAPITTERIVGYQALDVLNNNFRQFENFIDDSFKALAVTAESFGDPKMIPTTKIREAAADYLGELQSFVIPGLARAEVAGGEIGKGALDKLDIKNIPDVNLFLKFADQGVFNEKSFLTPKQYLNLKENLNLAVKESPNNNKILQAATSMRLAMDKDFASVADSAVQKDILENSETISNATANMTQAEKNTYLQKMAGEIDGFGKELQNDFHMFSALVDPWNSMTAKKMQEFGPYLFTAKSLLGIQGVAKKPPSDMFDTAIVNILRNGSPESVNELRFLVGATDKGKAPKTGEMFMDRLSSRFLFDSFFKSFKYKPGEKIAKDMDLFKKVQEQGMVRTVFADEVLQKTGTEDLITQRKIKGLETIEGDVERITKDFFDVDLKMDQLGEFAGVDQIRKNLGILRKDDTVDSMGKERLVNLFGGGDKGKTTFNNLEKFLDVLDAGYSQVIGEGSKYLTRRIGLTGAGAFLGGALFGGIGGGVGALILTPLLLRGFGHLISDPKFAKALLDVYTPEQRVNLAQKGRLSLNEFKRKDSETKTFFDLRLTQPFGKQLSPSKARSLGILLNYFANESDERPVDVNKLTPQQVIDFLNDRPTKIPNTQIKTKDIPENMVKRISPEVYIYNNATLEDKKLYDDIVESYADGAIQVKKEEIMDTQEINKNVNNQMMTRTLPQMQGMGVAQPSMPQNIAQQAPPQPGGRPQSLFTSLFPNDPTLQLLNERQNART